MSTDNGGSQSGALISPELFVESVRDLGLTTTDAVNEFIDNSFDASAENIWITIRQRSSGSLQMIVEDDGVGITRSEIRTALQFGGHITREGRSVGKFGFGLPSSAFCQSDRTLLYSKTADQDTFYSSRLDVDELKDMSPVRIPEPEPVDIPSEEYNLNLDPDVEQGTIIVLDELRNPQRKKVDTLHNLLEEKISEIQRHVLHQDHDIYINGRPVPISDPLIRMEDSEQCRKLGTQSTEYAHVPIEVPDVIDEGEDPPTVDIRLFKLPIEEIIKQDMKDDFGINTDNQGFYVIRENRQIGRAETFYGLFTRHNRFNYFRGEVRFPSELDDKFGVQTNKSRFALDDTLRERMEDRLLSTINSLGQEIEKERKVAEQKYNPEDIGISESAQRANKEARWLDPSGYDPDEEEKERTIENVRQNIEELLEKDLTAHQEELARELLEYYEKNDQIFRVEVERPGTGDFYGVRWEGPEIRLQINPDHEFYDFIYEDAEDRSEDIEASRVKLTIDFLLLSLAKGEDTAYGDQKLRKMYQRERRNWSKTLKTLCETELER